MYKLFLKIKKDLNVFQNYEVNYKIDQKIEIISKNNIFACNVFFIIEKNIKNKLIFYNVKFDDKIKISIFN